MDKKIPQDSKEESERLRVGRWHQLTLIVIRSNYLQEFWVFFAQMGRSKGCPMVSKVCQFTTLLGLKWHSLGHHDCGAIVMYIPENYHGTGKWTPWRGESFWEPFSGSMLVFGGLSFVLVSVCFFLCRPVLGCTTLAEHPCRNSQFVSSNHAT